MTVVNESSALRTGPFLFIQIGVNAYYGDLYQPTLGLTSGCRLSTAFLAPISENFDIRVS